jgi:hypothetical protein
LVEHKLGARLVLSSGGVRDQRSGSDTQHLGQRQHNHHDVSRHANGCNRFLPEVSNPIKIGQ